MTGDGSGASGPVVARWAAAAFVASLLALVVELVLHAEPLGDVIGGFAYLTRLSLLTGALACAPLAIVHAVRIRHDGRSRWVARGVVVVLAVSAAYPQAAFLTSGDGVAGRAWTPLLTAAIFASLVAALVACWEWHRFRLGDERRRPVLALVEVSVWATSLYAITYWLTTYQYFVAFALFPIWLLGATIAHRALRSVPTRVVLGTVVLMLVVGETIHLAAPVRALAGRTHMLRHAPIIASVDARLGLGRAPAEVRFELTDVCTRPPPDLARRRPERQGQSVILLSIDALRTDVLTERAGDAPLAPEMSRFLAESWTFSRAVTPYPATLLAVGAALTGIEPTRLLFSKRVPDNVFALSRRQVDAQFVMLPDVRWFRLPIVEPLFLQGARAEFVASDDRRADRLVEELRRLRAERRSVLAWAHFYAPHRPYRQHPEHDFGSAWPKKYRSEVAWVDRHVGRILEYLRADGWLDDSLVVLFSDHGEALGELDYYGHHVFLSSWISDVPLAIHLPGRAPHVIDDVVSITDIAPTVLDFLGIEIPSAVAPRSLARARDPNRAVVSQAFPVRGTEMYSLLQTPLESRHDVEGRVERVLTGARRYLPRVALTTRDHRLVVNRATGLTELYDRAADPGEQNNLFAHSPERARPLLDRLHAWHRARSAELSCIATGP